MDLSSLDWVKYAAGMGCDVRARRDAPIIRMPYDIMLTQASSQWPHPLRLSCNTEYINSLLYQ